MQAMIALPDGSIAKVNVYRNGDNVTVIGVARHETPMGTSETVVQSRMSLSTFEWYQERAHNVLSAARSTLAYHRLLKMAGVTDDDVQEVMKVNARSAPALPVANRMRLNR